MLHGATCVRDPSSNLPDVPPRFFQSLRARLLLLFAALAVGPLLTVGVFDFVRSRRLVDSLITTQTDTIARRAAATIIDRYAVIASDILLFAENADVQRFVHALGGRDTAERRVSGELAKAFLNSAWHMDSTSYYRVELRDLQGALLIRLTNDPDSAYAPARPTITSPIRDLDTGRRVGTLVLTPRIDMLLPREALGPAFGRTGYNIIIDRAADRILMHPNARMILTPAHELVGSAWTTLGTQPTNASGTLRYGERDSARIGSFVSLASPEWTVLSSTAVSEFSDTFARTRAIDVAFILLLGGAVAVAFVVLVGRATRSLVSSRRRQRQWERATWIPRSRAPRTTRWERSRAPLHR